MFTPPVPANSSRPPRSAEPAIELTPEYTGTCLTTRRHAAFVIRSLAKMRLIQPAHVDTSPKLSSDTLPSIDGHTARLLFRPHRIRHRRGSGERRWPQSA